MKLVSIGKRKLIVGGVVLVAIAFGAFAETRLFSKEESNDLYFQIETILRQATEEHNPELCSNLPSGPYYSVDLLKLAEEMPLDVTLFWLFINISNITDFATYPRKDCIAAYAAENTDEIVCAFYDEKGFDLADQAFCYYLAAQFADDASLCMTSSAGEKDFLCLAVVGNAITHCTSLEYPSELYHTREVTPAYCIYHVEFLNINSRNIETCLLITEDKGWNWANERNACLRLHALKAKFESRDYQDICALMAPDDGYPTKERCENGTIM